MAKKNKDNARATNETKADEFNAKIDKVIDDGFSAVESCDPKCSNAVQRMVELKVKTYQWRCSVLSKRYRTNIAIGDDDNPLRKVTEIKITCVS
jgi:hypothetical protein